MLPDWLSQDQIAAGLIRAGASVDDAFEASERVAIEREGKTPAQMGDAIMAARINTEIMEKS